MKHPNRGFTLIELLVVIAIIAVLAVVVVLVLNPMALLQQARDSNRLSDLNTLSAALNLYNVDQGGASTYSLGSSSMIYISIPDPTATTTAGTNCAGLGFPANGNFHCAASSTYRNTNGTGWLPVNFSNITISPPISALPVDPTNNTSSYEYYVYQTNGSTYELMANPESQKYAAAPASFIEGSSHAIGLPNTFPGTQNIWVADQPHRRIEEFSASGTYLSQFGSSGSGNGQLAFLIPQAQAAAASPINPATDAKGNVWVADAGNNRIEEFSPNSAYEFQFGSAGSGNGQLNRPFDLVIDASGNIWVVDTGNNRVEEFSTNGTYLSQFGSSGSGNGLLSGPYAIAIDASGNIWVVDNGNNRIEEFSSNGTYLSQFGSSGSGNGLLSGPYAIAIDASGNIWVADSGNNRVQEFSATGTYEFQFGSLGSGNGLLSSPDGIAIDASGNIWVADSGNNRIEEFSSNGTYEFQFGSLGSGNGQLNAPVGIAIH
jgi:prepilin-type N-terminal cleavage/methylation domain-containing protein